jgi:protein-tyrosine kinase
MNHLAHISNQDNLDSNPQNDLERINQNILDRNNQKMGPMLLANGKLNPKSLAMIIAMQEKLGLRFGDAAIKLGLVKEEDINAILAEQFAYTATPLASSKLSPKLSALFQPDSHRAEAMRSLRSELLLRYFNPQPHSSLAFIAAEDAAGIALTTADLAISFAQLGLRTLLIDANLREPQLHTLFDLNPHAPGLSDWIAGRAHVLPTTIDSVRSLWLLPAGTQAPNPQELIASKQYAERLKELTQEFEITLISTAPIAANRDAQLVAVQAGAALLLVNQQITKTKAIAAIANRLRELGVRILGTALQG